MKSRHIAVLLSVTMTAAMLAGCNQSKSSTSSAEGSALYGAVTEVGTDSITIEIQDKQEESKTTEETTDNVADKTTETTDQTTETTESTGETKTVKVTDDTKITMEMSGGPGGEAPSGTPPQKPGEDSTGNSDSTNSNHTTDSSESSTSNEEKPSGEAPSGNGEKPSGEAPDGNGEKPSGEAPDGNGEQPELELSNLKEGDTVEITLDSDGNAKEIAVQGGMGNGGPGGGQAQAVESYDAANEYTTDTTVEGKTLSSTGTDENTVHAYEGASVTLKNDTITRKSSDSTGGDSSSFYGVGAAVLETDGTTYVSDSKITTDAKGGAGVFAYGDGTAYVADTEITTSQDTSGGIHAAGGGKLYAWDVTATTSGESSAAIRSDRGGGTMVVDGGTYTSNGTGSPAVYSTADITINDADLTATGSEAVCIEGLNTLRLYNSDLTGNMPDNEQNDCTWNVILYQSMSGDSEVGNSTFTMDGGTLTAKNGGMFYTTNTESTFVLSDVDITYAKENDFFLRCTGNANQRGWGTSGENGADTSFTGIKQEMQGDIIWDSISKLDFYATQGSTLTGAVTKDDTYAANGSGGYCNVSIDKTSKWVVTGDSELTSLDCAGTIVDEDGKTVTIKGSDGTVYVKGTGKYTITVESYSEKGDVSGAQSISDYSEYAVEKPAEL